MFESVGNYLDSGKSYDIITELDKKNTQKIQDWLDRGGLTLLLILALVIVSVYHVAEFLKEKDPPLVAWAIAIIADWGFFNFVSFILNEKNAGKIEWTFTGAMAVGAGFYSVYFHLQYYKGDILLALFIPFTIVLLAWVSHRQHIRYESKKNKGESPNDSQEKDDDIDRDKYQKNNQENITIITGKNQIEIPDGNQGKNLTKNHDNDHDENHGENADINQQKNQKKRSDKTRKKKKKNTRKKPQHRIKKTKSDGTCIFCGKSKDDFSSAGAWVAHFKDDSHQGEPPLKQHKEVKRNIITNGDVKV